MDKKIDIAYLGYRLIQRGFEVWFRYIFKAIEQTEFIKEPIHKSLFEYIERVYTGEIKRLNINIPPRAGKTTLATYLLVYAITKNPKSNIIYTSYSQSLLADISLRVKDILENPVYKAMYSSHITYQEEEIQPEDDFWREYLRKETGKNTYSAKKIITSKGGICLFASIGSQITGYGAGLRNAKGFSGALIIDDANKPDDIYHTTLRNKVIRYFSGTLLSRLNNSDVPIINIQQRLHLEDLSGILKRDYGFEVLKRPLVDENGICQLPSQYTAQRLKELQIDNYVFQSQYQQEPIILGGSIIKREWFNYYSVNNKYNYKKIIIAADTAMTAKEHSDYTCFLVGGVTETNQLHILQMVHSKLEYPELKQTAINLYNSWQFGTDKVNASGIYIENKASGIQLIQELKSCGLPTIPIDVTKDKLTRVEEVLEYIASGQVYLPENATYGQNNELLSECEAFTRDLSHSHDDIVDALVHLINSTIANRRVSIFDVL